MQFNSSSNKTTTLSYTNAIKKPDYNDDNEMTPKKDQGIIIDSIDGINLKQYMECISNIVKPENILYASRLSRDKICMYLKSKQHVSDLTNNYESINIEGHDLNIRPLIIKSTKFYLNKIDPRIPSSLIHDVISNLNINITSKIQREKLSSEKNNFAHVYSFRRTFYGIPNKGCDVPDHFYVRFDDENYRIYINTDVKRCMLCRKIGHLKEFCPVSTINQNNDISILSLINNDTPSIENGSFTNKNIEIENHEILQSQSHIMIDSRIDKQSQPLLLVEEESDIEECEMIEIDNTNIERNDKNKAPNDISPPPQKKVKAQSQSLYEESHEIELKQLFSSHIQLPTFTYEFLESFMDTICKKEISEKHIKENYLPHMQELHDILENLRTVARATTKYKLTIALRKLKTIAGKLNIVVKSDDNFKNNSLESV